MNMGKFVMALTFAERRELAEALKERMMTHEEVIWATDGDRIRAVKSMRTRLDIGLSEALNILKNEMGS